MRRGGDPRPYRSLLYHGPLVVAGACACVRALLFVRDGSTLVVGGTTMLLDGGYRYRAVDDASFDAYGREAGVWVMVLAAALWAVVLVVTTLG